MGTLQVVVGGQYGSEGKGAIAAYLAKHHADLNDTVAGVRVAGPNAGHTVWGPAEPAIAGHPAPPKEWKLRSVPVAAVADLRAQLVIAAGSEIDPYVLESEISDLDAAGYGVSERLRIDQSATLLKPLHIEQEGWNEIQKRLGSTAKGIGAARADRIWRTASLAGELYPYAEDTQAHLRGFLRSGGVVQIEGTQGYGLGLHAGEYPYCTSSDCRAVDFLAMTGLSPWAPEVDQFEVYVVLRTRPIRVAGNSGRLENEKTWGDLGLKEERTTVTNKVRRVGEWDADLARRAVDANGGSQAKVALTMLDQMFPEVAGTTNLSDLSNRAMVWVQDREREIGARVWLVGTSPTTVVRL
jgi:adenylosuccinate synthase